MTITDYQSLANLYQPKIDEYKSKIQDCKSKIEAYEVAVSEKPASLTTRIAAIAAGILAAVSCVLTITSILVPVLLPVALASCALTVGAIAFRIINDIDTESRGLNPVEQKDYAHLLSQKTLIELHIHRAEERLKANQKVCTIIPNYFENNIHLIDDFKDWSSKYL